MANAVLITSVTGIVVSGVVGPAATSWAGRRAARRQFLRDQAARRLDDLRALFDEAAIVLGLGPIRLREIWEVSQIGAEEEALREWSDQVYVIGQRLQLRLGADDPVVRQYETVRTALGEAGEISPDAGLQRYEQAVSEFESARDRFLAAAQARLDAPIAEKDSK